MKTIRAALKTQINPLRSFRAPNPPRTSALHTLWSIASPPRAFWLVLLVCGLALLTPMTAFAQAVGPSSLETMLTKVQNFFTSTIARVAGIVSMVIAGLTLAYGEQGSKSKIAFTAIGIAVAVGAVNIYTWLTT